MKIIDVITPEGHVETVVSLANDKCLDYWVDGPVDDGRRTVHLLVGTGKSQSILDGLQSILGGTETARIVVSSVVATVPAVDEEAENDKGQNNGMDSTREELLNDIAKNSQLNLNFFILVFLSTVVAAVGLIKNNVAVVIGAMVIAPLLGPNLALALGTALGEKKLMLRSIRTNLTGLGLTLVLSMLIGLVWPPPPLLNEYSPELLTRTLVGFDSAALALAAGAAAVLSLTTGLSSVLVGVMVAVALMPPAVTVGLMLVYDRPLLAGGALLLLAVNVVCLNLAANLVFFAKGVGPRTWRAKKQASISMISSITFWGLLLLFLMIYIHYK